MKRTFILNDDQYETVKTALKVYATRAREWRDKAGENCDPEYGFEDYKHYCGLIDAIEETEECLRKQEEAPIQCRQNGSVCLERVVDVLNDYLAPRLSDDIVSDIMKDRG